MATLRAAATLKRTVSLRRLDLVPRRIPPFAAVESCGSDRRYANLLLSPAAPYVYRFNSSVSATTGSGRINVTIGEPCQCHNPALGRLGRSLSTLSGNTYVSSSTTGGRPPSQRDRLDTRADVKLLALSEAKARCAEAKRSYDVALGSSSKSGGISTDDASLETMQSNLLESELELSAAFRQAIKYVARTRQAEAASMAEGLLEEMIGRCGVPATNHSIEDDGGNSASKMLDGTSSLLPTLPDITSVAFPPPGRREFHNVLHSWASSKARRKGLRAEALLFRMAELSWWYPQMFDTLPDSKTFALVAKCHAGSTHSQALDKIQQLHTIHDIYADRGVPGIFRHDPFFLSASLKALKNYRNAEEAALSDLWFSQLHAFVMDPANNNYVIGNAHVDASNNLDPPFGSKVKVDMAGTYTTIIREYARLHGQKGAAAKARNILTKMQELAGNATADIATIDIKSNAYNLVFGSYRDSREERYAVEALSLLDQMIDAWKNRDHQDDATANPLLRNVPFPTEQSFELSMQSLASLKDTMKVRKESQRLLTEFESMYSVQGQERDRSVPTTKVYNSMLETYTKCMHNDAQLISMISSVIDKMKQLAVQYPKVVPDVTTWSLVLRACSMAGGNDDEKTKAFAMASETFKRLEGNESNSDESSSQMTDKCYFHMMKCVGNLMSDKVEKRDRIVELFADACEKGLVSADVLRTFQHQVPTDFFLEKVGSGRLADKWIANVTSGKALYTDGTVGGAGKNARRKGKSTSDWAKKQRKKEEEFRSRKEAKAQRKLLKKLNKNEDASKKGRKVKNAVG